MSRFISFFQLVIGNSLGVSVFQTTNGVSTGILYLPTHCITASLKLQFRCSGEIFLSIFICIVVDRYDLAP